MDGMSVSKPQPADLAADLATRRRIAGASRETMAAGLGLSLEEVRAVEDGSAPAALRQRHAAWLDRIEAGCEGERAHQLLSTGRGQHFEA
jgi:hypothetical protein